MATVVMMEKIPYIQVDSFTEVLRGKSSSFFASFRSLDLEKRQALEKVYGLARILDDCVDEIEDVRLQEESLAFWKKQIDLCYQGVPDHALMKELLPVIQRFQIPQAYFLGLIEGCQMDASQKFYESFDDLYEYCYRVASVVGLICMRIFEYKSPTADKMAVELGLAFQITNILRDINEDFSRGRIYLPKKDLEVFGYTYEKLSQKTYDHSFYNLMNFYYRKANAYYESAEKEFEKDHENKLVAAKVMARSYRAILEKLKKENFPVYDKKISLSFFEKIKILFWMMTSKST